MKKRNPINNWLVEKIIASDSPAKVGSNILEAGYVSALVMVGSAAAIGSGSNGMVLVATALSGAIATLVLNNKIVSANLADAERALECGHITGPTQAAALRNMFDESLQAIDKIAAEQQLRMEKDLAADRFGIKPEHRYDFLRECGASSVASSDLRRRRNDQTKKAESIVILFEADVPNSRGNFMRRYRSGMSMGLDRN